MEPIKDTTPFELKRLIELGRKGKLWRIVVMYNVHGCGETKLHDLKNLEITELMNFRENMFRYGFKIQIAPGHWKIICPMDVVEVDLYQQSAYFFDAPGPSSE
jgi:hypothetical protein